MAETLLRSTVRALKPYTPFQNVPPVRMDLNEAPADVDPVLKTEALAALAGADWSRYPGAEARAFAADLAQADGWIPEGVLLGNGSNELLQVLLMAALEPGARAVFAAPSFSLYSTQARAHGAALTEVPLRDGPGTPFRFDVDALVAAAQGAALLLLATPNNPTGTLLAPAEVARLCDQTSCLVVVDEAYREFAGQDLSPLLDGRERLVLLRTFSKAQAAAGLRVGYLLSAPWLVLELKKIQMPFNLGLPAAVLGRRLLAHRDQAAERVARVRAERERLWRALSEIPGVAPHPSGGNFVLFETPHPAPALRDALVERGVLVRDCSGYAGCARALRVTAGKPENGDLFLSALRDSLSRMEAT